MKFHNCSFSSTHHDYMGLALKQWSVYLGNVLLNFIHKECKNGNVCSANREQHINNFMNQQIKQQQLNNNVNNHRTNSNNISSNSSGSYSCHQHSQQQYCPSCHYHNQLQHLMSPPSPVPQVYYNNGYANFFNNTNYNVRLTIWWILLRSI